jgi:hypothetical protein
MDEQVDVVAPSNEKILEPVTDILKTPVGLKTILRMKEVRHKI